MTKKTLEQLQEEHSEMLATASDLGMSVPEDLTVDFTSVEVGATVCSNLDALIRNFRAGIDASDEDNGGDEDFEVDPDDGNTLAPADEGGKQEAEGNEGDVAKRATSRPKKIKTEVAAPAKEEENEENDVTDTAKDDAKAAAAAAKAKEKEKAAAAKAKEKEKAAAAKAKEKAAKEKEKAKAAATKEKEKAAAAKAKEKAKAAAEKEKAAAAKVKEKTKNAATKEKAATAKARGGKPRISFDEAAKISWSDGKKNPAREGKGRHDRIEKVIKFSGKTVKAFIAAGGNPTTLRNCVDAKLCTVG